MIKSKLLLKIIISTFAFLILVATSVFYIKSNGYWLSYQTTASMPIGWYIIKPARVIKRNEIVVFKAPRKVDDFLVQHQWLLKHSLMMKHVKGMPGDRVCIKDHEVWINHKKIAPVYRYYAKGKALPQIHFCGTLARNEYWLMSTRESRSFDCRYFGPVSRDMVKGMAKQL